MVWMMLMLGGCELINPPPPTAVTLTSKPEAVVFVDGERQGSTPWAVPAERLPVDVTLRANGYSATSVEVSELEDLSVSLSKGCDRLIDYDGRFLAQTELTAREVVAEKPGALPMLRNEVYAQYGRAFTNERFKKHFERQDWYEANDNYDDEVLTDVDKANVNLLKSFEGDPAKRATKVLERGQFSGKGRVLAVVDDTHAEISESGGDIYEWERQERFWLARGEWVITWESPEKFTPSAKKARLWKLDLKKGKVLETQPLRAPKG